MAKSAAFGIAPLPDPRLTRRADWGCFDMVVVVLVVVVVFVVIVVVVVVVIVGHPTHLRC